MQFFFLRSYGIFMITNKKMEAKEMVKITFMGAGSTIFAKNVLGDTMLTPALCDSEIALYDIDADRLEESYMMLTATSPTLR